MKKIKIAAIAGCILASVLWSCDNDIDNIGEGIIGVDPNEVVTQQDIDVKAFSTPVNPVQTNNFDSFLLGTYDDPVYGKSDYSFVSQVVPSFLNPDFTGTDEDETAPVLTDVRLEVPYFSRAVGVDGEETLYELDSIYGQGLINIKVYRNQYFLNDLNPDDLSQRAAYFSNQQNLISSSISESNLLKEINNFEPSPLEVLIFDTEGDEVIERKSPRINADLLESSDPDESLQYWSDILFNSGDNVFDSAGNFKNSFRGIYFTAELVDENNPLLMYLDLSEAAIIFSVDVTLADSEVPVSSEYRFQLQNNGIGSVIRANFIENDIPSNIATDIENSYQPQTGSESLYLKGGEGAIALVDLFGEDSDGDGQSDALTEIINNRSLINDAILEFYVDQDLVTAGIKEPERIIIYNFETGNLLLDFDVNDQSPSINNNLTHLGRLERVNDNDLSTAGIKYRIRITTHLNAIISDALNDDIPESEKLANNRLAIAVSQNVNNLGVSRVRDQNNPIEIERILESTAISHEGTVLHGNLSPNVDKRPKLTIYYSTPD